jgi:hypothetical protein
VLVLKHIVDGRGGGGDCQLDGVESLLREALTRERTKILEIFLGGKFRILTDRHHYFISYFIGLKLKS